MFLGRHYSMLSVQQALTPIVQSTLSVLSNLGDTSGLVGSTLIWSVRQDVELVLGGYAGYGSGIAVSPVAESNLTPFELQSEFGALKWMGFAMMATYF